MVEPQFERRRTPTTDPSWFEAHLTLAITDLGSVVIWTAIHAGPSPSGEQVCILWPHTDNPTVMIESEIPVPRDRWEFRTSGLWVEQVCETAHEHWSFGLEAFALEVDSTDELVRTGYGIRVPMGWEFDFYGGTEPRWLLSESSPVDQAGIYTQPGILNGDYLDGSGTHPLEGPAQRWHWWGTKPLTSVGIRIASDLEAELLEPRSLELPLRQGVIRVDQTPQTLVLRSLNTLYAK